MAKTWVVLGEGEKKDGLGSVILISCRQCPPVNKFGPPFTPPKFRIISLQTNLGEMRSLSGKL